MPKRDRRTEIMEAVEKLFSSRHLHEVTLDDVAGKAGVGKGTIYRYFKDKDDLFFQTATSGFDHLCELLTREVHDDVGFEAQLVGACKLIRGYFDRHRPLLRMMRSEDARLALGRDSRRREWMQHREKLAAAVGQIIGRGRDEGTVRADVSDKMLSRFLLGMLRAQARGPAGPKRGNVDVGLVVDMFLNGAAGRRTDARGRKS